MSFLHSNIMGQSEIGFNIDLDEKDPWWKTLVVILIAVVAAIAIIATFGALLPVFHVIWTVIKTVFSVMSALGITQLLKLGGIWLAADAVLSSGYEDNMFLPLFSYSPEEIFSGQILLFDVDFFNPQQKIYALIQTTDENGEAVGMGGVGGAVIATEESGGTDGDGEAVDMGGVGGAVTDMEESGGVNVIGEESVLVTGNDNFENYLAEETTTTAEGNTITIKRNLKYYYYLKDPNAPDEESNRVVTSKQNMALQLQPLISQWYIAIRNIAIVLSMSVLLYVGIRMLLASVAQEKAKYKQMLLDWIVGVCLLFFMHYIMAFSVSIVKVFNEMLSSTVTIGSITTPTGEEIELEPEQQEAFQAYMKQHSANRMVIMENDEKERITKKLEDLGMESFINTDTDPDQIMWLTNLMGVVRIRTQVSHGEATFIGYGIAYVVLVLFTLYFSWMYLKRVLYMAFLTLLAPLVALTYPIDKISDGQAQGFNKWLKEYIFNLLIQPLHLLLYTILVTSAIELATTNILYTLVAIGFLIPAEKILRNFFGFEKASTPGSAAGAAAGAALLTTGIQSLLRGGRGLRGGKNRVKGGNGNSIGDGNSGAPNKIGYRTANNLSDGSSDNKTVTDKQDNEKTTEQKMLDADDDKFGTEDWDPAERDAYARAAYANENNTTSDDTYRQLTEEYRDAGMSDKEIAEQLGYTDDEFNQLMGKTSPQSSSMGDNASSGSLTGKFGYTPLSRNIFNGLKARSKTRLSLAERGAGFRAAAGEGARQFGRKVIKGVKKGVPMGIRMVGKVGAGLTLGLGAATVAGTAAIVSGDPMTVAKAAGGAGVAGGVLGSSMVNVNPPKKPKSAAQIARERAEWGDKYDQHEAEKRLQQWRRDADKRIELERILGKEKVQKMYKGSFIDRCLQNDITDTKNIAAMYEVYDGIKDGNENQRFEKAALAYEINDLYGDIRKVKPKDQADIESGYAKQFNRNLKDEKKSQKEAENIMAYAKQFSSIKDGRKYQ